MVQRCSPPSLVRQKVRCRDWRTATVTLPHYATSILRLFLSCLPLRRHKIPVLLSLSSLFLIRQETLCAFGGSVLLKSFVLAVEWLWEAYSSGWLSVCLLSWPAVDWNALIFCHCRSKYPAAKSCTRLGARRGVSTVQHPAFLPSSQSCHHVCLLCLGTNFLHGIRKIIVFVLLSLFPLFQIYTLRIILKNIPCTYVNIVVLEVDRFLILAIGLQQTCNKLLSLDLECTRMPSNCKCFV